MPLLSISIPTYERSAQLAELLWGVCTQIERLPESLHSQVNVWIQDNASADGTRATVEKFQARYPFIHYNRAETNQGADRNVLKSVREPDGEFVWIICDDDVPTHGAVGRLLRHLDSLEHAHQEGNGPKITLVHSNGFHRNVAMNTILQSQIYRGRQNLSILPGEAFAKTFHNGLLRASTLIFRKSSLHGEFVDRYLIGYLCSPLVLALQALSTPEEAKSIVYGSYLDDPLITYRENHKPWFDLWPLIAAYYIPLMAFRAEQMGLFPKNTYRPFLVNHAGIARKYFYKIKKFPAKAFSNEPLQERWPIDWVTLIKMYAHCLWFWDECIWFCLLPFPWLQWALKHSPIESHLPTFGVFWLKLQVQWSKVRKKSQNNSQTLRAVQAVEALESSRSKVA